MFLDLEKQISIHLRGTLAPGRHLMQVEKTGDEYGLADVSGMYHDCPLK
jgi:hypothetical protein